MDGAKAHFLAFLSKVAGRGRDFRLRSVGFAPSLEVVFAAADPRAAAQAVAELNAGDLDPAALRVFRVPAEEARLRLAALGVEAALPAEEALLWEYRGALYPFDAPPAGPPAAPLPDLDGPLPLYLSPDEAEAGWLVRARAGRAALHTELNAEAEAGLFAAAPGGVVLAPAGAALLDRLEAEVRAVYAQGGFEEFRPFAAGATDPAHWLAGRLPLPAARLPYRFFAVEPLRRAPAPPGFGLWAAPLDRADAATAVCDLAQAPLLCGEVLGALSSLVRRFGLRLEARAVAAADAGGDDLGLLAAARVMARAHGFPVVGEERGPRAGLAFSYVDPAGRRFRGPSLLFERECELRHVDRRGRERRSVAVRSSLTGGFLRLLAASLERGLPPVAGLPGGGRP